MIPLSPSTSPRIRNIQRQNIRRPHLRQPIHHHRYLLLSNHTADRNPPFLLQRRDSRCALAGRDIPRLVEEVAGDVVLAEDEPLSGYHSVDALGDYGDEGRVGGVGGFDEHGGGGDDGVDGGEAGGAHGFAGFCRDGLLI